MKTVKIALMLVAVMFALAACGGASATPTPVPSPTPSGDPVAGETSFMGTCSACHGPDAKGVTGLGKDLTTSTFAIGLSDADLVAFLLKGRPSSDPANTTGVDMPPKGGNPSLSEKDLANIVAYIRTLEK